MCLFFGLRDEAGALRENPRRHGENMQTDWTGTCLFNVFLLRGDSANHCTIVSISRHSRTLYEAETNAVKIHTVEIHPHTFAVLETVQGHECSAPWKLCGWVKLWWKCGCSRDLITLKTSIVAGAQEAAGLKVWTVFLCTCGNNASKISTWTSHL